MCRHVKERQGKLWEQWRHVKYVTRLGKNEHSQFVAFFCSQCYVCLTPTHPSSLKDASYHDDRVNTMFPDHPPKVGYGVVDGSYTHTHTHTHTHKYGTRTMVTCLWLTTYACTHMHKQTHARKQTDAQTHTHTHTVHQLTLSHNVSYISFITLTKNNSKREKEKGKFDTLQGK